MEQLSELYMENTVWFDRTLGVGRSMDIVSRDYVIGGRRARLWVVDGYGKDETLERMGAFWLSLQPGCWSRRFLTASLMAMWPMNCAGR